MILVRLGIRFSRWPGCVRGVQEDEQESFGESMTVN
jgi:hypothetical protein